MSAEINFAPPQSISDCSSKQLMQNEPDLSGSIKNALIARSKESSQKQAEKSASNKSNISSVSGLSDDLAGMVP